MKPYATAQIYASPALPNDVTFTVVGTVTGGSSPVDMAINIELFDPRTGGFTSGSGTVKRNVPLNVPQTFIDTFTKADLLVHTGKDTGTFRVRGNIILQNPLGKVSVTSPEISFNISPPPIVFSSASFGKATLFNFQAQNSFPADLISFDVLYEPVAGSPYQSLLILANTQITTLVIDFVPANILRHENFWAVTFMEFDPSSGAGGIGVGWTLRRSCDTLGKCTLWA